MTLCHVDAMRYKLAAMIFRSIEFGSASYDASLLLRERVLRKPLGKILSGEDTADEENQLHFGLFRKEVLVACVVMKPLGDGSRMKLRQMAVAESGQGQGLGRALVSAVEVLVKRSQVTHIEMSARLSAEGFYRRLGYERIGDPYPEQGIPHIRMWKNLDGRHHTTS
jgi:predicted GNAT family N-acyltransferase